MFHTLDFNCEEVDCYDPVNDEMYYNIYFLAKDDDDLPWYLMAMMAMGTILMMATLTVKTMAARKEKLRPTERWI